MKQEDLIVLLERRINKLEERILLLESRPFVRPVINTVIDTANQAFSPFREITGRTLPREPYRENNFPQS